MAQHIRSKALTGINPLAYMGVEPITPPNLTIENRSPTTKDGYNFNIGALWLKEPTENLNNEEIWILVSLIQGSARWIKLYPEVTPGGIFFDTDTQIVSLTNGHVKIFGSANMTTTGTLPDQINISLNVPNGPGVLLIGAGGGLTSPNGTDGQLLTAHTGLLPTWEDPANELDTIVSNSGLINPLPSTIGILGGTNMNTSVAGSNLFVHLNPDVVVPAGGSIQVTDFSRGVVQSDATGLLFSDNGQDGQFLLGGATSGVAPQWVYLTTNTPTGLDITSGVALGVPFLNIDLTAAVATAYRTDSGPGNDAVPSANLLQILGTANEIETSSPGGAPGYTITVGLPAALVVPGTITVPSLIGPGFVRVDAGGAFSVINDGTDGQLLIGKTGNPPIWANLTAGANITITNGANSIQISAAGGGGGGGLTTIHGNAGDAFEVANAVSILGSGNMTTTGDGVNTLTITISNGPTFTGTVAANALTSTTTVVAGTGITATTGDITASAGDIVATLGDVTVSAGTLNLPALGEGVMYVDNTNAVITFANGTNGQLLIAATAGQPAWANLTSTGGSVTITNGANSINLEAAGVAALTSLASDSGSATPVGGVITIAGGLNIGTTAAAATLTVNLDTSVFLPHTNAGGTTGVFALGASIAARFMHDFDATPGQSTWLGSNAGNLTLTTANNNTGIGRNAINGITTGSNNVGVGGGVFSSLTTGSNNIALGASSGSAIVGTSSNILIGNAGDVLDSNALRIGTQGAGAGQINKAYVAGIYNTALGGGLDTQVVMADSNGKLGALSGGSTNGNLLIGGTLGPQWAQLTGVGGITITPGDHTIQISGGGGGGGEVTINTQSGSATSVAGVFTINGGENVNTTASMSTVVVNLNRSISWPPTAVNAGTPGGYEGIIFLNSLLFMHARGTRNTFLGQSAGTLTLTVGSATDNVAVGANIMSSLTTGQQNTAVGSGSMVSATSATKNTCVGYNSGNSITNSTGTENTLVGFNCGDSITTGQFNTALGSRALAGNVTGNSNVTIGYQAGNAVTSNNNIIIGANAAPSLPATAAGGIIVIGTEALQSATQGCAHSTIIGREAAKLMNIASPNSDENTIIGYQALTAATGATACVAIGSGAMDSITTSSTTGAIAIGYQAGRRLDTGSTAVGYQALSYTGVSTSGENNTAIGYQALENVTADNNTAVGYNAGQGLTGTSDSILIGANAGVNYTSATNSIVIGLSGTAGAIANTTTIGDTQTSCYVQGVYNQSVAAAPNNHLVSVDNTGKLGLAPIQSTDIPAFMAKQSANVVNVTGDNTLYQLSTGVAFTEIFDLQNNLVVTAGNLAFTAPITGKYWLNMQVEMSNLPPPPAPAVPAPAPIDPLYIVTSNRTYSIQPLVLGTNNSTTQTIFYNVLADMDVGDTCVWQCQLLIPAGTKTIGVTANTYVSGFMAVRG